MAYSTDSEESIDFWDNSEIEKTLQNAINYFVQNHDYSSSSAKSDFAVNIMQKIIGKKVDKRKLLQLLELELLEINLTKIPVQVVQSQTKSIEDISIFDADRLNGFEFEKFIAEILESNGFSDINVTRGSGDQGGDISANRGEEKLIIQAKRYSIDKKVKNNAVQEVKGAIAWYNANKGVVVTNSIFTNSAKELAKINNIELWDRKKVSEFIKVYNAKQELPDSIESDNGL